LSEEIKEFIAIHNARVRRLYFYHVCDMSKSAHGPWEKPVTQVSEIEALPEWQLFQHVKLYRD
jgi:hypothetical protein